ncbi:MAG: hypothetical protein WBG43_03360 [Marinifilaceae bacterium]
MKVIALRKENKELKLENKQLKERIAEHRYEEIKTAVLNERVIGADEEVLLP